MCIVLCFFWYSQNKKRGVQPPSFHDLRLSHCLLCQNRQREAHADIRKRHTYNLPSQMETFALVVDCGYTYILEGILPLQRSRHTLKIARFQIVRTKHPKSHNEGENFVVNAFYYVT